MADTVRVQFSASIGALIKGVEDAKSAIESVKESTDKVTAGAKSLLEVFGVAFSSEKIIAFVGQMAELGEQVERSSAILGTSTKSVQELGFIAKSTGGDAEGLSLAMERLQVNLQKAQSGAGPAYQALKALGLSAKELSSLSLDQQLNKIADAFAKFGDGPNKTAIAIELLGRAGAQMIPVLDQGSDGLEKLRGVADNTGAVLSKTAVDSLSALERALVGLKGAVTGAAGALVAELAPALTRAVTGTTELIGSVNVAIQTHTVWQREMIALATGAAELGQALANLGTIAKDVFTLNWGAIASDRAAGLARVEQIQKEGDDKINAIARQAATELQKILAGEPGEAKPQAPSSAAPDRSAITAQMEQFQTQIKLYDAAYKQTQEILAGEVKLHQITYDQETQLLLQALNRRHTEELAALNTESQIAGLTAAQYQKLIDQKLLLDQKWRTDHDKIVIAAAEKDAKEWQAALTPFTSAFDSQLKGLLDGTENWATATKRIIQDLVLDGIKYLEKLAIEKAAVGLTSLTGGGPTSLLGGLLGGGQAAAQTANTTAVTALTAAVAANTVALSGETAVAAGGGAAAAAGGAGGLLSGFKSLFSLLGIAALDVGGYVLGGGLAMIHAGETITPANVQTPYAGPGGSSGGGVTHNWNIMAWDGPSVQSWLTRGGTLQLMKALSGAGPLNPSLA